VCVDDGEDDDKTSKIGGLFIPKVPYKYFLSRVNALSTFDTHWQ
jgi:hypothetical protein